MRNKIRSDSEAVGDEVDDAPDLLTYIQEARHEERTPDFEMLQRRVLAQARARVPYRRVTVDHDGTGFVFRTD